MLLNERMFRLSANIAWQYAYSRAIRPNKADFEGRPDDFEMALGQFHDEVANCYWDFALDEFCHRQVWRMAMRKAGGDARIVSLAWGAVYDRWDDWSELMYKALGHEWFQFWSEVLDEIEEGR